MPVRYFLTKILLYLLYHHFMVFMVKNTKGSIEMNSR